MRRGLKKRRDGDLSGKKVTGHNCFPGLDGLQQQSVIGQLGPQRETHEEDRNSHKGARLNFNSESLERLGAGIGSWNGSCPVGADWNSVHSSHLYQGALKMGNLSGSPCTGRK